MTFSKRTAIALALIGIAGSSAYAQMSTQTPSPTTPQPSAPMRADPVPAQQPSIIAPVTSPTSPSSPSVAGSRSSFQSLDRNGDGIVSRSEAAGDQQLTRSFDQYDRNRDGRIDSSEAAGIPR